MSALEEEKAPTDRESVEAHATQSPTKEDSGNRSPRSSGREPSLLREELEACIAHGLNLMPLRRWDLVRPGRDGKPVHLGKLGNRGWSTERYDSRRVVEDCVPRGINVGVQLTERDLVVDVDPRNGGEASLEALRGLLALLDVDLDAFPRVRTGSGGLHVYMRKPEGVRVRKTLPEYPGIDFLSRGCLAVAPGSIHPRTGENYRWEVLPGPRGIPEAPAALVDLVRRPERASGGEGARHDPAKIARMLDEDIIRPDHPRLAGYEDWIASGMAACYASDGDPEVGEAWARWSCRIPGHEGCYDEAVFKWTTFRPAGGTTDRFLFTLSDGAEPADSPESDFEAVEVPEGDAPERRKRARFQFMSLDELEDLPPPEWLVEDLILESSLTALYGPPASFKSFLALDVAASVASGTPWHGREVRAGGVLYLAAEGAPGLGKRMRAWRRARGVHGSLPFHAVPHKVALADPKVAAAFLAEVRERYGRLQLVVVDTLAKSMGGRDENSQADMGALLDACEDLRIATGATVLLVHHSGKDSSKGLRGSSALLGGVDASISVRRQPGGRTVEVVTEKQKDDEEEAPMSFAMEKVELGVGPSGKPVSSLVPRMERAPAESDFTDGQPESLRGRTPARSPIELVCDAVLAAEGRRLPVKDAVALLMRELGLSESTARRAIREGVPGNRRKPAEVDGIALWQERDGPHDRAPAVIRARA